MSGQKANLWGRNGAEWRRGLTTFATESGGILDIEVTPILSLKNQQDLHREKKQGSDFGRLGFFLKKMLVFMLKVRDARNMGR